MTNQKETKKKILNKWDIFWIVLVIILVVVVIVNKIDIHEQVYCYRKNYLNYSDLKGEECMILGFNAKNIHTSNVGLGNMTCTEDYETLPPCDGEVIYYTQFPLENFCVNETCDIEGWVCMANYVTLENYTNQSKMMFEMRYIGIWEDTQENLDEIITDCRQRVEEI